MSSRDRDLAVEALRANLRSAGIPAPEEDIERVVAEGIPDRAVVFRALLGGTEDDSIPDALSGWSLAGLEPGGEGDGAAEAAAGAPVDSSRAAPDLERGPDQPWPSTIAGLAPLVRSGAISPVELTEQALARIEEDDGRSNAFQLVLAEEALAAARRTEDEVASGAWRGPLHGIPVAVKDLLAMKDTVTTCGSKILADQVTDHDAAAVERLRAAGAVIVGKTRLSEFAYWPGSTNPHYGPTPNPRDPTRDAGGSSSGSAAAVARGMVYAALGTDTGGSIRIPAALVRGGGLKPTFGRARASLVARTLAWSRSTMWVRSRAAWRMPALRAGPPFAGPTRANARTRPASALRGGRARQAVRPKGRAVCLPVCPACVSACSGTCTSVRPSRMR